MISYFKNKAHFRNFTPLFIKNIVFSILSFFQLYIMTNYLDAESYGKLQFILAIVASIIFFTLPGSNLAYNKMGARGEDESYFPLLKHKIKFSLFGSLAILCISLFYFDDKSTFYGLLVASAAFPIFYNLDAYLNLLNGQEKFHEKVKYEILRQSITVTLLTATVVYFSKDIVILLFVVFSTSIIFNALAHLSIFQGKGRVTKYLKKDNGHFKSYRKYTQDMSWLSVIGAIEGKLDRLIVGIFFGFTNLAIFHVAKVFQDQFKNLWVVFANLIIPKTYHKKKSQNIQFLLKALIPSIAIFLVIVFLAIALLPLIFSLFPNEQYIDSLDYLTVMLFTVVLGIPNAVLVIYFNTNAILKDVLLIRISSAIVYFICLIVFSYYWHIWGIIYAGLLKSLYASLVTIIMFFIERKKILNEDIVSI